MGAVFDRVYEIVERIPLGRVASYGDIARMMGAPRLSRAVGYAMHAAPEGVPCHRVVSKDGGLSDAFEPLGRDSHRLLLEMEGVGFLPDGRVDMEQFRWLGIEKG